MNEIENLNEKLLDNPKLFIDVFDSVKRKYIEPRHLNAEMILKDHSSIMDFYKSFHAKGFDEIGIISKKKNGTSYIDKQLPIPIVFQKGNQPAPNSQTPNPQPTNQSDNMLVEGLGAGAGKKELSLDDYIELNFTKKEHKKLVEQFSELKTKHTTEFSALKTKYTSEKKKRKRYQKLFEEVSTKNFLETPTGEKAISLVETLGMAFIEKKAGVDALAGGSNPAQQPKNDLSGLNEDKQAFVKEILTSPKLTNEVLKPLSMVAVGLSNSPAFIEALNSLLTEYDLTPE